MKQHKLKIYRERPIVGCGCCTKSLSGDEMKGFKGGECLVEAGGLYMKLKQEYAGRLDVQFYDPRCFVFLFDTLRYRLRGGEVTWVLDGKVIYRGVPQYDELKKLIDEKLAA